MKQFPILAALSLSVVCCVLGCGSGERVQRASVQGQVTLDGQPIEIGMILFIPEAGVVGPPVQILIENGTYQSDTSTGPTAGLNVVQITAMKKTGKIITFAGEQTEEKVQYIPARYNEQSTLQEDIQPGKNQFDFALES